MNKEKKIIGKYWNFFRSHVAVLPDLSTIRRHQPINVIALSGSYSLKCLEVVFTAYSYVYQTQDKSHGHCFSFVSLFHNLHRINANE